MKLLIVVIMLCGEPSEYILYNVDKNVYSPVTKSDAQTIINNETLNQYTSVLRIEPSKDILLCH